ncbi:PKD domain-containing protein [Arthrobacter sp. NPDC058192]|uniref:PKD domain-containing protein n=1 Tax=Arthrobacter sp. NPDC058192 TaxID=3346372 RepID=UPI0036E2496E
MDVLGQIAAQIQTKFRQLPVTPGKTVMQPSPHTLRGAETNFYAEASEQTFNVDMLGQDVFITAKPVQYTWSYGDGTSLGPQTVAGGSLPQDRWGEKTLTSHVYAQTGDFSVILTTHFQGTYSVNGGPQLPIPGQGQFSSPQQSVSVWRSITRNYADTCLENPQGQGCPGVAPASP